MQCQEIDYKQPALKNTDGVLAFSDNESFDRVLNEVSNMSDADFEAWEKKQGFTSSRTILKKAIELEESYLAEYFNKNSNLGRNSGRTSIGYYPEVKAYIDLGTIYTDSLGLLQSNTTNPELARIVNEKGIVKIGRQLIQYGRDFVKIIEDGNNSKVAQLKNIWATDSLARISIYPVKRVTVQDSKTLTNVAKVPCLAIAGGTPCDGGGGGPIYTPPPTPSTPKRSCERESNGYKLLVYLEHTYYQSPSGYKHDYSIKLVSLCKSFWGGWDYCKTGFMGARGYVNANCYATCLSSRSGTYPSVIPIPTANYNKQCPYGSECYIPILSWYYDIWTWAEKASMCYPNGFQGSPDFIITNESHYAYSKEGMSCTLPY